jgi:hypothetical protein
VNKVCPTCSNDANAILTRIAYLETALAAAQKRAQAYENSRRHMLEIAHGRIAELETALNAANLDAQALARWAVMHDYQCPARRNYETACTCGLTAVIAAHDVRIEVKNDAVREVQRARQGVPSGKQK